MDTDTFIAQNDTEQERIQPQRTYGDTQLLPSTNTMLGKEQDTTSSRLPLIYGTLTRSCIWA